MSAPSSSALTRRYLAAVALLVLLCGVSWFALTRVDLMAERDGAAISLAARQTLLVERATRAATQLQAAPRQGRKLTLQAHLDSLAQELAHTRARLRSLERDALVTAWPDREVRAVWSQPPYQLDTRIDAFLETMRQVAAAPADQLGPDHAGLASLLAQAEGDLAVALAVGQQRYEWQADKDAARLRIAVGTALIGALGLILLDAILVFRPLAAHVQAQDAQLRQANARLEGLAVTDPLTGLANRRAFTDRMAEEWRRAARRREPLSVLMIDVDHFKAFNDHYGHVQGDRCLAAIAAAIGELGKRSGDGAARYGGEEFVLLLPDTDGAGAIAMAQRLVARIEALGLEHAASSTAAWVTVSVGAATTLPSIESPPLALVEAADAALYEAKSAGRNRAHHQLVAARPIGVLPGPTHGDPP